MAHFIGESEFRTIPLSTDDFEKLLEKNDSILLSREDRETLQKHIRSMDELRRAIIHMPTSVRLR